MQAESQAALVLEHESAQTVRYLFNQARGHAHWRSLPCLSVTP